VSTSATKRRRKRKKKYVHLKVSKLGVDDDVGDPPTGEEWEEDCGVRTAAAAVQTW